MSDTVNTEFILDMQRKMDSRMHRVKSNENRGGDMPIPRP